MGKESFEAGKYYSDQRRHICFVTAVRDTGIEVSMWDSCSKAWGQCLTHKVDGSFANGGAYDLVLEAIGWDKIDVPAHPEDKTVQRTPVAAAEAPAAAPAADPSIQRDKDHEPVWLPARKAFDSFPDLADWSVTSGTQEQPKPATGWWARG